MHGYHARCILTIQLPKRGPYEHEENIFDLPMNEDLIIINLLKNVLPF